MVPALEFYFQTWGSPPDSPVDSLKSFWGMLGAQFYTAVARVGKTVRRAMPVIHMYAMAGACELPYFAGPSNFVPSARRLPTGAWRSSESERLFR